MSTQKTFGPRKSSDQSHMRFYLSATSEGRVLYIRELSAALTKIYQSNAMRPTNCPQTVVSKQYGNMFYETIPFQRARFPLSQFEREQFWKHTHTHTHSVYAANYFDKMIQGRHKGIQHINLKVFFSKSINIYLKHLS